MERTVGILLVGDRLVAILLLDKVEVLLVSELFTVLVLLYAAP